MPTEPISLTILRGLEAPSPILKAATLHYVARTTQAENVAHDLQFLHRVRDPKWTALWPDWATSDEAVSYYQQIPAAANALLDEIGRITVDLVVAAPSRRRDVEPYLAFVKQRFPDAMDLSRYVHRVRPHSAGAQPGPAGFVGSIALSCGSLHRFRHVLIVDDVFASGTTASAMTTRFEQLGLPPDAAVRVAAPLLARPHQSLELKKVRRTPDEPEAPTPSVAS